MRHFACYGDERNKGSCVHCGGPDETKDHFPSKVLLDEPLPANVFVSPACFSCNNGPAPDEEYVAALVACVLAGDVDPVRIGRPKIAKTIASSAGGAAAAEGEAGDEAPPSRPSSRSWWRTSSTATSRRTGISGSRGWRRTRLKGDATSGPSTR
jgi:hypothetical protein